MSRAISPAAAAGGFVTPAATLGAVILDRVQSSPDRVAFLDERGSLTYAQLGGLARALAARLEARKDGEPAASQNVAILAPSIKEYPALYYAVLLAGRTPVPLNFLLEAAELEFVLRDAEVNTCLASKVFAKAIDGKLPRVHYIEDLTPDLLAAGAHFQPMTGTSGDGVATLIYTSGTTGRPKGVELTHRNLVTNVEGSRRAIEVTSEDRVLATLPMFHSFALTVTMNLVVAVGARAYMLPRFGGRKAMDLLAEERISLLPLVPSMYRVLLRSAAQTETIEHSLRIAVAGGEPLPADLAVDFRNVFGVPLLEGYGLTETSPVLSFNRPHRQRLGTVGEPLDNVEIDIVDEAGRQLGVDQDGEIRARGPSVMRGYRNRPEETRAVLSDDGWFHTGDIGRIDAEGFLKITGRKKEMIISCGENIFPREIEDALSSHEAVFEAAIIGVPDKMRGELPYGFVALREGKHATADELREHLRGRLADYKVPRTIEILAELPHSPTGKILKRALKPSAD